jgi:peptide/nickel transport system permease protein
MQSLNHPSDPAVSLDQSIVFPTPGQILRRRILHHRSFMIGAVILALIFLTALFAPLIAPHDPYDQDMTQRLVPAIWDSKGTWAHPLGTDNLGRDYLSRLIYGSRISLLIGLSAMLISCVIGTTMGIAAGYFGGWTDLIVSFLITVRLAMPLVLVALAVVALIGGSLQVIIQVLGFLIWDRFAVVMRTSTQQTSAMQFVKVAKASGCSTLRILLTEILPNNLNQLIVVATLEVSRAVLVAAALSFLGMGVQPPLPSWGLMLSEGKELMFFNPYLITIPGVALFILILCFNLIGDGIRDITDPGSTW